MTGRTFRMVVGLIVILADVAVYLHEHIVQHIVQTGWQAFKDHVPYLALAWLLIDWKHAKLFGSQLIRRLMGAK